MSKDGWYWCLKHNQVEPYYGCRSATRLGPYPTAQAAGAALQQVAQRNEDWDNDPRFNDVAEQSPPPHSDTLPELPD
ncbi:MAG: hypothetical protein LBR58_11160 [Propionibacteriaceae bacterium]|nr:hypothetical protein [Propionibacteriaceae bacterium]